MKSFVIGKLDGIASKVSAADRQKWLTNPAEMEKALEKKPTVAYLQTLK